MSNNILGIKKRKFLGVSIISSEMSNNPLFASSETPYQQSSAISEQTRLVLDQIEELKNSPSLTIGPTEHSSSNIERTTEENLFDACANVKIITSQVSMHLRPGWREKLFHQLDQMHNSDDWDLEDEPVKQDSFRTFIKWIVQINPERGPGLGLTTSGNIIAAWVNDGGRLTVEFLPNDQARWVVLKFFENQPERASGQTSLARLSSNIAPYSPEIFYAAKGE
jgi:hypothetical protein